MLVAVFDTEARAGDGLSALEALAEADTIRLNAAAIVSKTHGGAIAVSRVQRPAPEATLGAGAIGTLVGMLTGVVGLAIGTAAGLAVGAAADMFDLKVERDILAEVERQLQRGKSAVVAQIYEEETGPVNARIAALGGVVLRRALTDVADREYGKAVSAVRRRLKGGRDV